MASGAFSALIMMMGVRRFTPVVRASFVSCSPSGVGMCISRNSASYFSLGRKSAARLLLVSTTASMFDAVIAI